MYPVLHETGFASQPTGTHRDDGLTLTKRLHHRGGALRAAAKQANSRGSRKLCAFS